VFPSNNSLSSQNWVSNNSLNNLLSQYGVTSYEIAFPQAKLKKTINCFRIKISTPSLYNSLANELSSLSFINEVVTRVGDVYTASDNCTNGIQVNDPSFDYSAAINLNCAWEISQGDPNNPVAVVDIFIDNSHDDLDNKIIDIRGNCQPGLTNCNHGYMVAGAVAAIPNNNICTAGTGFDNTVVAYCFGTGCNSGSIAIGSDHLWDAYLDGISTVSFSMQWNELTRAEAEEMTTFGTTIVVAAYGTGHDNISDIPGVIKVGRVRSNLEYWPYNCFEPNVDIFIPTESIHRTTNTNGCAISGAGTSHGCPLVAGIVALMQDANPCLNPADYENILKDTHQGIPLINAADQVLIQSCPGIEPLEEGLIDAYAAVCLAQDYCAPPISLDDSMDPGLLVDRLISGDLIIQTGTELTINSQFNFSDCSRLIVERGARLIVDGGTLTSCNTQWQGIIVEGSNFTGGGQLNNPLGALNPNLAGTVVLRNGAIIENANTAISMVPTHLGNQATHFGGLVDAEDSVIRDCNRGMAFMSHMFADRSQISNCEILNVDFGITLWECDDVLVENTCFDNITNIGILTIDSDIIVQDGCQFTNMPVGIRDKDKVATVRSSDIGNINTTPNFFDTRDTAIHIVASVTNEDLSITNNNITGGISAGFPGVGVGVVGQSFFVARHNELLRSRFAIKLENAGSSHVNLIDQNLFFENGVGVQASGTNGGALITNNCFIDNVVADISISSGNVYHTQCGSANTSNAAGNSFSKTGAWEIYNQGASFTYCLLNGTQPTDPEGLSNSVGLIVTSFAGSIQTKDCGSNNNLGVCDNFVFISGIETGISDIEADNWIESRELVLNNASVDYDAVDFVELRSGFEVDASSDFMAFIDGCDNGAGGINFKDGSNDGTNRSYDALLGTCEDQVNSESEILQLIKDVESNINEIKEDEELSAEEKAYLLSSLEICINKLILKMGLIIFENDLYTLEEKIENYVIFYNGYDEFRYRIMALGVMIRYQHYDQAEEYLTSIETENEEQDDYLFTQSINIAFSKNPFTFELNDEERSRLNEIKVKEDPLSIFAYNMIDVIDSDYFFIE